MKSFLEWSAYQKHEPTSKKEAAEMNLIDETQSRFLAEITVKTVVVG